MLELLHNWLLGYGLNEDLIFYVSRAIAVLFVLFLAALANFIAKRFILSTLTHIISKTKTKWDDAVLQQRALNHLTHLAPALVIFILTPLALLTSRLTGSDHLLHLCRMCIMYYHLIILLVCNVILSLV